MTKPKKRTTKKQRVGPNVKPWHESSFYGELDFTEIDGRTRLGRSIKSLKSYLRNYVGGNPDIVAELLIQQITYKVVKLVLYQSACLQDLKNEEAEHFLPLSNSLRQDLKLLSEMAGETESPDIQQYLKEVYGGK